MHNFPDANTVIFTLTNQGSGRCGVATTEVFQRTGKYTVVGSSADRGDPGSISRRTYGAGIWPGITRRGGDKYPGCPELQKRIGRGTTEPWIMGLTAYRVIHDIHAIGNGLVYGCQYRRRLATIIIRVRLITNKADPIGNNIGIRCNTTYSCWNTIHNSIGRVTCHNRGNM